MAELIGATGFRQFVFWLTYVLRRAESSLLLALVAGTATSSRCRLNRRPCVPLMRCRSFPDIDLYGQKNMEEQRARYGAGCHNGNADCPRDCMVGVGSRPLWNHRYRGFPQLATKKAGGQSFLARFDRLTVHLGFEL
jgi:hypothetical protein